MTRSERKSRQKRKPKAVAEKEEHSMNDKSEKLSVLGKKKMSTSPPKEICWGPTIYCSKQNKLTN